MISKELIQKYLRGDCTAEEEQSVIDWYNAFEDKDDPYQRLTPVEKVELRGRMLTNIRTGIKSADRQNKQSAIIKYLIYGAGAAAIVVLAINLQLFYKKQGDATADISIVNSTKMLYKQVLPDKSTVWLSPGSQIIYPKAFAGHFRSVRLIGESFFDVTKNHAHPFIIHSPHVTTKVWGTSFRITDNNRSNDAEVVVVTGKVSVTAAKSNATSAKKPILNEEVMLIPKQGVVYSMKMQKLQLEKVNVTSSINIWNRAKLTFDNVSLKDAIDTLNKHFGVKILLADDRFAQSKIQADFNGENLPEIMNILTRLLKLTYVTDGRKFMLQKGASN